MPPSPSCDVTSYAPIRDPGVIAIGRDYIRPCVSALRLKEFRKLVSAASSGSLPNAAVFTESHFSGRVVDMNEANGRRTLRGGDKSNKARPRRKSPRTRSTSAYVESRLVRA